MTALVVLLLVCSHPWGDQPAETTLAQAFPPPEGCRRVAPNEPFAVWLRSLPIREDATVRYFDGRVKPRQDVQAAVIDIDVGSSDLQQCADAVIRLRAEFLFASDREDEIRFDFTSGDPAAWADWRVGGRPSVQGNRVTWRTRATPDDGYANFRRYLRTVFAYAGTASLESQMHAVADPKAVRPGDVFIQGGFPGHAVMVVDVVENPRGERFFLLAQSYMPAQDVHVLRVPSSDSPWYPAKAHGVLKTPEWRFDYADLRRW